jgi:hypothetical protein
VNELGSAAETLASAWREQNLWSQAADRAKREYVFWRNVALGLTLGAAFAATAAGHLTAEASFRRVLSFIAAAFLAALGIVGSRRIGPDRLRTWIRARSASEGLKSEVYLFLTRTDRYTRVDARDRFAERVATIRDAANDLLHCIADLDPRPPTLPKDPLPIGDYIASRVDKQITDYYRPKAAGEARLVRRYRSIEFVLALSGALLGVVGGVADSAAITPWSAALTAALAAIAAHLAAGRHEYQTTTYTATALELERLSSRFKDLSRTGEPTREALDDIVKQCEAAISVENQGWMTQWEKPVKA